MMSFQTINVVTQDSVCYLRFNRESEGNTINQLVIDECLQAIDCLAKTVAVLVIEGGEQIFCNGADFNYIAGNQGYGDDSGVADRLYQLWLKLAVGPFVSVSHVRGQVNAGGIGFISACDLVLADASAHFSLSEMLFNLYPACVFPFLVRRIGFQRAHYLTLSTKTIGVQQACEWGLVDAWEEEAGEALRKHLLRMRKLSTGTIAAYKRYVNGTILQNGLEIFSQPACAANRALYSSPEILQGISKYTTSGAMPWMNKKAD